MRPRVFALRSLLGLAVLAVLTTVLAPACSLGAGTGSVNGTLNIPDCWAGGFDLKPDFFAAVPYASQLVIRIQNGSDYQEFSDGLSVLVDDVSLVQTQLGQAMKVSLSPEVTPPGVPVKALPDPGHVHASLYLQRTCRVQNVALYALDTVSLNANGQCADDPTPEGGVPDGGTPTAAQACGATGLAPDAGADGGEAGAPPDASAPPTPGARPTGSSWIRFRSIFDGIPDESDASKRLNDADFELFLADPREICPGGLGPPPPCRGHITGSFKFYFQRGRPAQPFP